ncbi:hypothetical protein STEG23_025735, partial [Scotinomys teguina]
MVQIKAKKRRHYETRLSKAGSSKPNDGFHDVFAYIYDHFALLFPSPLLYSM